MGNISKETELPMLTSLEIEPGEIVFDSQVNEYSLKLEEGTDRILVRARTQDEGTRYTVSDTDLRQGRNEIMITVTGADGKQNIYRLHVIVGEELETTSAEHLQETLEDQMIQSEIGTDFFDHIMTGRNRYISFGICGCAGFAFLLWIVFIIKRFRARRETIRQQEQRELLRQEREKRYEMARMQQEELLRQIDELKKKSRMAGGESASGLRIIHLDDDQGNDDEYDDIDDYDDEEDSDDN